MKKKLYAVVWTVLMFGLGQTVYAQIDKGVTSSGKEVDCSTIDPSSDKTVNEYGKVVTSPRLTRNGKLITAECEDEILVTVSGADSKQFCSGGNVNVEYTASHPGITGTGISYKWYVNDVLQTETGASFTATFSSVGTYKVSCDVSQGTANGSGYKMTSVEAFPLPTVVVAGADQLCEGINTTLTATSGFTSYVWSSNVVSSTTNTAIVNAGGTYTVTVTDANGCQNTASKAVTGYTLPVVAITGDSQVCGSESVTLTATSDLTTYVWSSNVASSTNNTATVNAGGTYTVTATDANGCQNTASKTITGYSLPTVSISANNNSRVCGTTQVTLTAPSGFSAYAWSSNIVTASTTRTAKAAAGGTYTVTVTDGHGCKNTASKDIAQATVTGDVTISGTNSICSGSGTTLTVSGVAAGDGSQLSYKWYKSTSSTAISGATSSTYSPTNITANTTYRCVVTPVLSAATSCAGPAKESSYAVTVTTPKTGTLAVSANPATIWTGSGASSTLTASVSGTTAGTLTYQWYSGSSAISGATATTYTVTPTSTTTYKCIETATLNSCTATAEKSVKVTVAEPSFAVTAFPETNPINICDGNPIEITFTADYMGPYTPTYSWTVSGGTLITASNIPTIIVRASSAGTVSASCTATYTGGSKSASKNVTVNVGGTPATMVLYEDYNAHSITITETDCNTNSIVWRNSNDEIVLTRATTLANTSLPAGTYIVSGTNSSGCMITKAGVLGLSATTTCYSTSIHSNETGTGHTITAVRDHENNSYTVLTIGGYCMTRQNMRCTTSPTGKPFVQSRQQSFTKSYWDQNTVAQNSGYLYNWHAAMDLPDNEDDRVPPTSNTSTRGICPKDWHVPSWDEWESIIHLHDAGQFVLPNDSLPSTNPWINTGAAPGSTYENVPGNQSDPDKNATGFSAVPAGFFQTGNFVAGYNAYFWSSSTEYDSWAGYVSPLADLARDVSSFYKLTYTKDIGYSVRCIRDY